MCTVDCTQVQTLHVAWCVLYLVSLQVHQTYHCHQRQICIHTTCNTQKNLWTFHNTIALSTGTMSCIHVCVLQYWITEDVVWYTICVPLV